ncbi:hypothetical protein LINPERHAP2_LOCUS39703 [Linum perenne]
MNVPWTIQCDGSFQADSHRAGLGVVAINSEGHAADGRAGAFFCRTPCVAEAYAVLTAARMASDLGGQVVIKSDCLEVVNAVRGPPEERPWEIGAIIADIDSILQTNPGVHLTHCQRNEVAMAHNTANKARLEILLPNWLANM